MLKLPCLLISALSLTLVFGCTDTEKNEKDSEPTAPDVGFSDAAQPEACSDGVTTCLDQTTIGVCADGDPGAMTIACSDGGCVENEGVAQCSDIVCLAGERLCHGSETVLQCNDAGTGFQFFESCETAATGRQCDRGTCIPLCILNEKTRTNIGCDYWAADLDNAFVPGGDGFINASRAPYAVVVSNPSETLTAEVTILNNEGISEDADMLPAVRAVPPLGLEVFYLPHRDIESTSITPKAYRVKSSIPIVAYQFNPLDNEEVFSNDASLLLPSHVLGSEYIVMTREQSFASLRGFLTVIATSDEPTQVTVTVTADTQQLTGSIPAMSAGDTFSVVLNKFDVLNIETGAPGADLTGSEILASQNVVVFGGSEAANVPNTNHCVQPFADLESVCEYDYQGCLNGDEDLDGTPEGASCVSAKDQCIATAIQECALNEDIEQCETDSIAACEDQYLVCQLECHRSSDSCETNYDCNLKYNTCCADHLEQQLFPVHAWGQHYVAAKSYERGNENDYWRIIAAQDGTKIDLNPPVANVPDLNRGEWYEFGSKDDFEILSDKPIMVGQFLASEHAPNPNLRNYLEPGDAATGDPAFILAVPVEQFRENFVFLAPDKYAYDYVTIVAPVGTTIYFDDLPIESFSDWVFLSEPPVWQIMRFQIADGAHFIQADAPVAVTVYGYDQYVSYGYPGGLNLDVVDPETGEAVMTEDAENDTPMADENASGEMP